MNKQQTKEIINILIDNIKEENTISVSGNKPKVKWIAHSEKPMTHAEAIKWCEEQGGRLPTIHELLDAYLSGEEGFKVDWYWSSTLDKYDSSIAYIHNFVSGNINRDDVGNGTHVRCVA